MYTIYISIYVDFLITLSHWWGDVTFPVKTEVLFLVAMKFS